MKKIFLLLIMILFIVSTAYAYTSSNWFEGWFKPNPIYDGGGGKGTAIKDGNETLTYSNVCAEATCNTFVEVPQCDSAVCDTFVRYLSDE